MKTQLFYGKLEKDGSSFHIVVSGEGLLYVGSENQGIDEIDKWRTKFYQRAYLIENWAEVEPYAVELAEYMDGKRKQFDLKAFLNGTSFQKKVWEVLRSIPYGETRTYTEIAEKIGRPTAVRAVGSAIGANPLLMVVPCHRVISKSGKLSGFRSGIALKARLLALEGITLH